MPQAPARLRCWCWPPDMRSVAGEAPQAMHAHHPHGPSTGVMNMCLSGHQPHPVGRAWRALSSPGWPAGDSYMFSLRRPTDFLWIALAVGGLFRLLPTIEFSPAISNPGRGLAWSRFSYTCTSFRQCGWECRGGASVSARHDRWGLAPSCPSSLASSFMGTSMFSMSVSPPAPRLLGVFPRRCPHGLEIAAPPRSFRADFRHPDEHRTCPRGPVGNIFPENTSFPTVAQWQLWPGITVVSIEQ